MNSQALPRRIFRAFGAQLSRFTVDRLMSMLDKLDQEVEVTVSVQPRL